jgi:hypothetical protein
MPRAKGQKVLAGRVLSRIYREAIEQQVSQRLLWIGSYGELGAAINAVRRRAGRSHRPAHPQSKSGAPGMWCGTLEPARAIRQAPLTAGSGLPGQGVDDR